MSHIHLASRSLVLLVLLLAITLGNGHDAHAQTTSWVTLAGGDPGLTNDGETRNLTWLWAPGGASISGTVDVARSGAGVHFVFAESHLDTILLAGGANAPYDNSPYATSLGGAAGILQFGSMGEIGRGPNDAPNGSMSTTVIDFRFDGTVTSPDNTILALFDPGAQDLDITGTSVVTGPAEYRFTAFYRGVPVDTSTWTVRVEDPYLPAGTPASWSWNAATGVYRVEIYPSSTGGVNFPDTVVFIDTNNVTFDRLVLTATGLARDSLGVAIGSANRPNLPITLDAAWTNATAVDAVGLTITGAGAETASAGSAVAPASSTAASANGVLNQLVTIRETFTRGDAADYTITWSCRRLSNNTAFASGTGTSGQFTMPTDSGVACSFTNTGRATLQLQKRLPFGRRVGSDQFTLAIAGPGAPAAVSTSGTGTAATGSVSVGTATVGGSYTFTEAAAAGANLADYGSNWSCTNTRSNGQTPSGHGTSFSLTPVAGDELVCSFNNSVRPAADLQVRKAVNPAGGRTGEVLTYTLTAQNLGPDPANGTLLRDVPGAGLDCSRPASTAICTAGGGAACPAPTVSAASLMGSGIILPVMPVGGSVSLSLQCTVTATQP